MNTQPSSPRQSVSAPSSGPLAPLRGLTLRLGSRIVNVHDVIRGAVYWGTYTDGRAMPDELHQCSTAKWHELARRAVAGGAVALTLIHA